MEDGGRRIGFFPGDVVQDFVAELLQGVADGKNDVMRAAHPNRAVGLEHALASQKPFAVELVVQFRSAGFIPVAFVHLHHAAGVAGDAAVGEEIGRVGKDGVEAAGISMPGINGVQQLQTISVIEADEGGVGAEDELGHGTLALIPAFSPRRRRIIVSR